MKIKYTEDKPLIILLCGLKLTLLVVIIAFIAFCFSACSDKYDSFVRIDHPPFIVTDKDTMNIRVKDYSGYFAGMGYIKIAAKDTLATGLFFEAIDTTGHLDVFYDSTKITGPIALNQSAILFVACKDTGIYPLRVRMVDRLDKFSDRTIPVRVLKNEPPVADLQIKTLEALPGKTTLQLDAGTSTSRMSRIVAYTFTINTYSETLLQPLKKVVLYSGQHSISVRAIDDLGAISPLVEKKVYVQ